VRSNKLSVDDHYDSSEDDNISKGNEFEEWVRMLTACYYEHQKVFIERHLW